VFGGRELGEGSNAAKVAGLSVELEAGWIRTNDQNSSEGRQGILSNW
jgi:hypothetical protein